MDPLKHQSIHGMEKHCKKGTRVANNSLDSSILLATMHLPKKAGPMTFFFSDGTHSTELFQLSWPNRLRFGAQETDLLQHSHVLSRPDKDQLISGRPSFCLELRPWTRGQSSHIETFSSTFLYAISNDERRDWVSKLRKHSVHYDLQNAYFLTDTILGRGAYGTVFLGKDIVQQTAVALKIIDKSRLNEEERKLIVSEIHISLEVLPKSQNYFKRLRPALQISGRKRQGYNNLNQRT